MRHRCATLVVLVLVLLSMLVAGTAQAGGPTSVLLVAPGVGHTASLYYSDADYNSLAILVEAFGASATSGTVDRSGSSHESGAEVTLTWLIHDEQVWRVDRVYVRALGEPWISSQVDVNGSGSIWDSPVVWHTATHGPALTSLLDRLRVNPAHSTDSAAATASSAVAQPTLREKHRTAESSDDLVWGLAGLVLGAVITVLAMRRFPNGRLRTRTDAGAETAGGSPEELPLAETEPTKDRSWSPSEELSWPAPRR